MAKAKTTKAIQKIGNVSTLKDLVSSDNVKEMLSNVATRYLPPERAAKIMLLAASRQPKLYECTPSSFLTAAMKAVEAGLDFGGATGQAYLVPFFNNKIGACEAQFIPGYIGLKDIVWRVARIKLRACPVYEKDTFEVIEGDEPKLIHKPYLAGDRGKVTHFYCVAKFPDGDKQFDWMTKAEVDRIRSRSKCATTGPWKTDYIEMGKKTVVRRIFKLLPSSKTLDSVLDADNQQFDFQQNIAENATVGTNGLIDRMNDLKKPVKSKVVDKPISEPQPEPSQEEPEPAQEKKEPQEVRFFCPDCDHEDYEADERGGLFQCKKCLTWNVVDRHSKEESTE